MIEFQQPWVLLALALVPVAGWWRSRRGEPAVSMPVAVFLPAEEKRRASVWAPRLLEAVGLMLLIVALARPVSRDVLPRRAAGIDILLCVDRSSSMAARDMDAGEGQDRLTVAKAAAKRFAADRGHDRVGLVGFAAYADLLCPPTLDSSGLGVLLDQLAMVPADHPEDQTGIGGAVARAAQILRNSTAKSRVVVLLTDGEENVATPETPDEIGPLRAARVCRDLGVRVYTVAVGRGAVGPDGKFRPLDTRQV